MPDNAADAAPAKLLIWNKTARGLAESKGRSLNIDPAARNLLLLIDGAKSEEMLLRHGIGVRPEHFQSLRALGLIEPVDAAVKQAVAHRPPPPASSSPGLHAESPFAVTLTQIISSQLGLAGFRLTDEVQRARSMAELQAIAERVIAVVRRRKGNAAAEESAWRLSNRR